MNEYDPDYVTPPGETLLDYIIEEFALKIGWSPVVVVKVMSGQYTIDERNATDLQRATGIPATFWLERERIYRESLKEEAA